MIDWKWKKRGLDMIQDIAPYRYHNEYIPTPPDENSIALYYQKKSCLLTYTESGIRFPRFKELDKENPSIYDNATYLFTIDHEKFYLVSAVEIEEHPEFLMESIWAFREVDPQYLAFAGITGYQLYNWYHTHQFCGKCGNLLKQDANERMLYCENCHQMEYPKISPAVIIAVTHNDRILLSKYAKGVYKNYALIAGYTEIGESLEETVQREVMEETGLKVKNIQYYKSQPWSFSETVLMGFFCELDGDNQIRLDKEELAVATWFSREEIPVESKRDSLTNEMIMQFKRGKR